MNIALKLGKYYLVSIDAVIRLLGTHIIIALMYAAVGLILNSFNWLFSGSFSTSQFHPWVGLLLAPPILRLGILAGGFSIPPLLGQCRGRGEGNNKPEAFRSK